MVPTNLWLRFSSALKFSRSVDLEQEGRGTPSLLCGRKCPSAWPQGTGWGQHALRGTKCTVACRLHMHIKYSLFCSKKHYLKPLK